MQGIDDTRQATMTSSTSSAAFVWDSTSILHDVMTDCSLEAIPLALNIRQFAIALPRGATYRSQLNAAILELYEQGTITALQNKQVSYYCSLICQFMIYF